MKTKTERRTEIMIEAERVIMIRRLSGHIVAQCPQCFARVQMVSPEEAAAIASVSVRTVNRWVEADALHFVETPRGALLICLNSLGKPGGT